METSEERVGREQGLWKLYGWLQSLGGLCSWDPDTAVHRGSSLRRGCAVGSSLRRGGVRLQSSVEEAVEREMLFVNIASHPMILYELGAGSALQDPSGKKPKKPSGTSCRQPGLPLVVHYFFFCASFLPAWSLVVLLFVVYCVPLVSCLPNQIHSSYFCPVHFGWMSK